MCGGPIRHLPKVGSYRLHPRASTESYRAVSSIPELEYLLGDCGFEGHRSVDSGGCGGGGELSEREEERVNTK